MDAYSEEVEYLHCLKEHSNVTLPWGVDFSEGGWATDFAAAILAFLFFVSSMVSVHYRNNQHFRWMFLGTAIAHSFGGLCHKYFFNRAYDGTGQVGFYVCMGLGCIGNCIRYGFGWGHGGIWPKIAIVNIVLLVTTAIWTISTMEWITDPCDGAVHDNGKERDLPDKAFMFSEAVYLTVAELTAGFLYLKQNQKNPYAICAVVANTVGFLWVYLIGALNMIGVLESYSPGFSQRVFHYSMIIMMWAINSIVVESSAPLIEVLDGEEQKLTGYGSVV